MCRIVHLRATAWPPCVRTTPLGFPVVPDVYNICEGVDGETSTCIHVSVYLKMAMTKSLASFAPPMGDLFLVLSQGTTQESQATLGGISISQTTFLKERMGANEHGTMLPDAV